MIFPGYTINAFVNDCSINNNFGFVLSLEQEKEVVKIFTQNARLKEYIETALYSFDNELHIWPEFKKTLFTEFELYFQNELRLIKYVLKYGTGQ